MTLIESDLQRLSAELSIFSEGYNITTTLSTSIGSSGTATVTAVLGTAVGGSQTQVPTGDITAATVRSGTEVPSALTPSTTLTQSTTSTQSTALTQSTTHRPVSTIAGVAVGVPVGLVAIALLFYILRRRHQHKKKESASANTPDAAIYHKAELEAQPVPFEEAKVDTQSDTGGKLSSDNVPRELDADSNMLAELPDTFTELDSRPVAHNHLPSELDAVSDFSRDISPITTGNDTRWSLVSSLATPSDHYPAAAGVAPIGIGLQAADRNESSQKYVHRARSPLSRMLPVDEAASSETSLPHEIPSSGTSEPREAAVRGETSGEGIAPGGTDPLVTTQNVQTGAESTNTPKHEAAPHGERQNWAGQPNDSQESSHQHVHSQHVHSHGAW